MRDVRYATDGPHGRQTEAVKRLQFYYPKTASVFIRVGPILEFSSWAIAGLVWTLTAFSLWRRRFFSPTFGTLLGIVLVILPDMFVYWVGRV